MKFPSSEIIEQVRKKYPAGTRVELLKWTTAKHLRLVRKEP